MVICEKKHVKDRVDLFKLMIISFWSLKRKGHIGEYRHRCGLHRTSSHMDSKEFKRLYEIIVHDLDLEISK